MGINPNWNSFDMPDWNKTTDICQKWSSNWSPCNFPWVGLSNYGINQKYCYQTFSEVTIGSSYLISSLFGSFFYGLLILTTFFRLVYLLLDTNIIKISFIDNNPIYLRRFNSFNLSDLCNLLLLLASILQFIRSFDLHAWSNKLTYKSYHIMGAIVHCILLTIILSITMIWLKLFFSVSLSTNTTPNISNNNSSSDRLSRLSRKFCFSSSNSTFNTNSNLILLISLFYVILIWLVCFPLDIYSVYLTPSCEDGCINTQIYLITKILYCMILLSIMICNIICGRMIAYLLKLNEKNVLRERLNLSEDLLSYDERRRYISQQTGLTSPQQSTATTNTVVTSIVKEQQQQQQQQQISRMESFTGIESTPNSVLGSLLGSSISLSGLGSGNAIVTSTFVRTPSNQLSRYRSSTNDSNSHNHSHSNNHNHVNIVGDGNDGVVFNRVYSSGPSGVPSNSSQYRTSYSQSYYSTSSSYTNTNKFQSEDSSVVNIHNNFPNNSNNYDKIIIEQSHKISMFVLLSSICSLFIIINDIIWCILNYNSEDFIYYISPPCNFSSSFVFDLNYWIYGIWFIILFSIIPSRQQQSDNFIIRVLLQRINAFMLLRS